MAKNFFTCFKMNMHINFLPYNFNYNNSSSYDTQTFGSKGQPISLKYIMQKRKNFLPVRVQKYVQKLIDQGKDSGVSLLDVHKKLYEPLLECKTLAEVKQQYPEFINILPVVPCQKKSVNSKGRTTENFGLKVLQEYWANLKTKNEIAQMFGMPARGTLDFSLEKINFIGFSHNYKMLLKASDVKGNKIIADKTKAWNKANPELRRELNKRAAQGCKTEEYRKAQSQRMYAYDILHPERRQKISKKSQQMWDKCPDVKRAMFEFAKTQGTYLSVVLAKHAKKQHLTPNETIVLNGFFKKFWHAHPELKASLSKASNEIRNDVKGLQKLSEE